MANAPSIEQRLENLEFAVRYLCVGVDTLSISVRQLAVADLTDGNTNPEQLLQIHKELFETLKKLGDLTDKAGRLMGLRDAND